MPDQWLTKGVAWPRLRWHFDPHICIHAPPSGYKGTHTGWLEISRGTRLVVELESAGLAVSSGGSCSVLSWLVSPAGQVFCRCQGLLSVRSRDPASGTERPPSPSPDPEHQQFPLPLIRAEIAPETPFVVSNGHTCRREARARGPRRRSSELRSRERDSTTGKSRLPFLLGSV